jgi:hypothetical protein
MLKSLVNNRRTDKNTTHSYLEVYELFADRIKSSAKNVLEIGVWDCGGILMFNDYFENANIYGLDIFPFERLANDIQSDLQQRNRIKLLLSTNAYDENVIKMFLNSTIRFDMIIDDGPHTLESQIFAGKFYSKLLSDTGILVIEDIGEYEYTQKIIDELPDNLKKATFIIDRRHVNGRYDDIMLIIDKSRIH